MYKITYTGNGEATEFHFSVKWFQQEDINVRIDGTTLPRTEFAVRPTNPEPEYETPEQAEANDKGDAPYFDGKVIFTTPPAEDVKIDIYRKITLRRITSYQPTEPINPRTLNTDFDYITEYLKDLHKADICPHELQDFLNEFNKAQDMMAKISELTDFAKFSDIPDIQPILDALKSLTKQTDKLEALSLPANADFVVESVSNANGWYRKYKSGWVEQGGRHPNITTSNITIALLAPMRDTSYPVQITYDDPSPLSNGAIQVQSKTTSSFTVQKWSTAGWNWEVKGFRA